MAVNPADLIAPAGLVEPSLFPGEDSAALIARMEAYLAQQPGVSDAAAASWAYHRAFYSAYVRLSAEPSTNRFEDQGWSSHLITQIQNLRDESDRHLADFRRLTADPTILTRDSGTASVDTEYVP